MSGRGCRFRGIPALVRGGVWIALAWGMLAAPPGRATPVELVQNGGFETGDFSGWTVSAAPPFPGNCNTTWSVSSVGGVAATGCQPGFSGVNPGAPVEGSFAAYNSFDAFDTPTSFSLRQLIHIPDLVAQATLAWSEAANLDFTVANTPTLPRRFVVDFLTEAGGRVLARPHEEFFPGQPPFDDDPEIIDFDWKRVEVDLSEFFQQHTGETLTMRLFNAIPEPQTGPGGFGLDAVSILVEIPEPRTLGLLAAGLLALSLALRRRASAPNAGPGLRCARRGRGR